MELTLCNNLGAYDKQQLSFPRRIMRGPPRRVAVPVAGRRRCLTGVAAECVKLTAKMAAVEAEEKEEEEWMKAARLEDKCGGSGGGVAEMLECLEKEAIMGDDHGREPHDYNRRAQIFDKSSRVFQALKDHRT